MPRTLQLKLHTKIKRKIRNLQNSCRKKCRKPSNTRIEKKKSQFVQHMKNGSSDCVHRASSMKNTQNDERIYIH